MIANQFFDDCNSWKDFQNKLITLNKKEKGNAFEVLTKLYFKINPVYSFYDAIWLLNEVPQTIIEELGIPSHDLGIDLIAKHGDEFHAIQHLTTRKSIQKNNNIPNWIDKKNHLVYPASITHHGRFLRVAVLK